MTCSQRFKISVQIPSGPIHASGKICSQGRIRIAILLPSRKLYDRISYAMSSQTTQPIQSQGGLALLSATDILLVDGPFDVILRYLEAQVSDQWLSHAVSRYKEYDQRLYFPYTPQTQLEYPFTMQLNYLIFLLGLSVFRPSANAVDSATNVPRATADNPIVATTCIVGE